jgi:transposase InsO family protein
MREEFYDRDNLVANTLDEMRAELQKSVEKYNCYRPHRWLKGMTPMEYINSTYDGDEASHMY